MGVEIHQDNRRVSWSLSHLPERNEEVAVVKTFRFSEGKDLLRDLSWLYGVQALVFEAVVDPSLVSNGPPFPFFAFFIANNRSPNDKLSLGKLSSLGCPNLELRQLKKGKLKSVIDPMTSRGLTETTASRKLELDLILRYGLDLLGKPNKL
jgi:hypothetical protein